MLRLLTLSSLFVAGAHAACGDPGTVPYGVYLAIGRIDLPSHCGIVPPSHPIHPLGRSMHKI